MHKTHFLLARLGADAFGRAGAARVPAASRRPGRRLGAAACSASTAGKHADERAVKHLLNYELPFDEARRACSTRLFARHLGDPAGVRAPGCTSTPAQVAEMARGGMTFGYHTRTHRMLSRLTPCEQGAELADGRRAGSGR